jgi:maltooligosyltrehalose trehalohydrolase
VRRRLPVGAELLSSPGVHFRVWAPSVRGLGVLLDEPGAAPVALRRDDYGYFDGLVAGAHAGSRYWFQMPDGRRLADPASRFQPEGPHGPSVVVDPSAFEWHDEGWTGISRTNAVIYEMHVGTFTPEGTWMSAVPELPALAELGVTVIQMMPVADFPGRFGWGYDGVNLFAPTRLYGTPDDLRRFVDAAHGFELGVILDVVYNHLGPDGCVLHEFSPHYVRPEQTEWGQAINFDGPESGPVREFFLANAAYWIDEFHFDGLRLDATQAIVDRSPNHIIGEIAGIVRRAASGRQTLVTAENEPQRVELLATNGDNGIGVDALYDEDFHHSAMVALTGRREAYYTDYLGSPQELVSSAKRGFLYQGQWYSWQRKARGTPTTGFPPSAMVAFLQNHDQVANTWSGQRMHTLASPSKCRALTALLLLKPSTPLLFQGQEFAASAPWVYFADHSGDLTAKVRAGRREFLSQFPSIARAGTEESLPDPHALDTFLRCRLDHTERESHAGMFALHAALLQLRASDTTIQSRGALGLDGALIGPQAFVLRFFGDPPDSPQSGDRLIVVNLGAQLELQVLPEPLLAPPFTRRWALLWSSEDPAYGGGGTPDVILPEGPWRVPAECALVFGPALPALGRP